MSKRSRTIRLRQHRTALSPPARHVRMLISHVLMRICNEGCNDSSEWAESSSPSIHSKLRRRSYVSVPAWASEIWEGSAKPHPAGAGGAREARCARGARRPGESGSRPSHSAPPRRSQLMETPMALRVRSPLSSMVKSVTINVKELSDTASASITRAQPERPDHLCYERSGREAGFRARDQCRPGSRIQCLVATSPDPVSIRDSRLTSSPRKRTSWRLRRQAKSPSSHGRSVSRFGCWRALAPPVITRHAFFPSPPACAGYLL